MQKTTSITGFLMMAAAMVLVGSTIVASKIIANGLPPFTATALRFAIAAPVFIGILLLTKQKIPALSRREWGLLLIQAAAGSVAYTVLLILGLTYTSGANASVIVGTLPIVMGILAIAAFGESPSWHFTAAIFVAGFGVFLITVDLGDLGNSGVTEKTSTSVRGFIGIGLIVVAVIAEALFLLLNKKIQTPIPALALSTLMCVFGFLLALIPAGLEYTSGALNHISRAAVMSVIYYALIPTVIGFLLWYAGSAKSTPGQAALATAFMPVSALILVAIVLKEPISVQQAAGCFAVIAAILIGIKRN